MMPEIEQGLLSQEVGKRDHVEGGENAKVTLIMYGDFECPYCRRAYPVVKRLQESLGPDLRFVLRHFPLSSIHRHAMIAAEAAEAAAAQGAFWEYVDKLFENQHGLDPKSLSTMAADLGLDTDRFKQELDGHVHASRVEEDLDSGIMSGVNGTPTFYISGKRYDGPSEYREMYDALLKEIRANE